ncbi:type IV pilus biogenesis/stability protein PilW [Pseudorhodoferax sp. Leaf267]|uniref:type IV pilus biogenesis/stability protein PilW n=1 Tax=Pseudorhodoferax sp. Leaf267 TaxID=1736316 RepID=UPI0006F3CF59|nr:type IV pilus biogenesis/stability protein PilW [Pseudorhodoferax sp. Leaf267]KQP22372.1 pilus assembly protein PilW [Pseudorhodoferax sp. Leaf267]
MRELQWSPPVGSRALCALALALAAATQLSGCATPQGLDARAPGADIVTPSDEPEVRRRARVRLQLASGYFDQGQTNVALDELKQSLAIDPTFADAYNLRGLIYLRLNDLRLAEESFQRALSLNPREPYTLHNYGWMLCQQERFAAADEKFNQALAQPAYTGKAKTFMAQGMCQQRAGQPAQAEASFGRSYELDPANPITGYNLAQLLYERADYPRAQFYIRRINNTEYANAESLWLGIKVERRMNNQQAFEQLSDQLRKRFAQSREYLALERRAFDE